VVLIRKTNGEESRIILKKLFDEFLKKFAETEKGLRNQISKRFVKRNGDWYYLADSHYSLTRMWMATLGILVWSSVINLLFPGIFWWVLIVLAIMDISGETLVLILLLGDLEEVSKGEKNITAGSWTNVKTGWVLSPTSWRRSAKWIKSSVPWFCPSSLSSSSSSLSRHSPAWPSMR